ncbi:selenocysteine-specific translation elongation factor [soil metagenome]
MEIIVGTAGHIDHGKTALVKALTGVDADRLPEEKRRGITVDLGFAELSIGDVHFGFVDVPGHEKFVKNMLAGASGVDLVVLVVASEEGVMPQTREHFEICRLLGIQQGIIALTKSDIADAETLELARMDVAELVRGSFLEDAPVISISARTGDGVDALKETLVDIASSILRDDDGLVTRLPIDRSFSVKGFGAVVTGTLASGELIEGSEMELVPPKKKVRVRGLQTHGQSVGRASSGQRVAVNLGGIDHSRVARGMMLSEPEVLEPTQIIDVRVEVLEHAPRPLRTRQRVRIHIGTIEALARVQVLNDAAAIAPGSIDLAQIRLEIPVIAVPGERFIIRSYSPQATIAGGEVIDPLAIKHRRRDLEVVRRSLAGLFDAKADHERTMEILVTAARASGVTFSQLQTRTGLRADVLRSAIDPVMERGHILDSNGLFIAKCELDHLADSLKKNIEDFHRNEPLAKGMPREQARDETFGFLPNEIFLSAVESLAAAGVIEIDKDILRLVSHRPELSPAEAALREKLTDRYRRAGLEVAKLDEVIGGSVLETMFSPQQVRKLIQVMIDAGEITKVTEEFYFSSDAIDKLIADLRRAAADSGDRVIDIPKFKEIAGVSRKYAIPLLEYLDREHVTARVGDKRVII